MKLYVKILFACVLSFLAAVSCVKDSADVVSHPDAIVFGIQSLDSVVTRTSYSGDGIYDSSNQLVRERIDWLETDMISVVCSQAQTVNSTHAADYSVGGVSTSTSDNGLSNATLTPVGSGLQWGSGEHTFYAMYPSVNSPNLYDNTEKGKIGISLTEFKGTIPERQTPQWNNGGKPDMKYAYMFAPATAQARSGQVDLPFSPQFTAFEFTVTSGEYASVSLSSFTFEALSDNAAVTGDFVLQNTNPGGTPSTSNVSRRITVDLTGRTVTPSAPLKFTVLALPTEIGAMRMTFEGSEIGTRTLVLKDSNDTEITFTARKKYRIGGITFPKDLSGLGEDILWDNEYILEGTLPDALEAPGSGSTVTLATGFRSCMEDSGSIYPEPFIFQHSSTGADGSWVDGLPDWLTADPGISLDGATTATTLNLTASALASNATSGRNTYVRLQQTSSGKTTSACQIMQAVYVLGNLPAALTVSHFGGTIPLSTDFRSCQDYGSSATKEPFKFQYSSNGTSGWSDGLPSWLSSSGIDLSGAAAASTPRLELSSLATNGTARTTYVRIVQPGSGKTTSACKITQDFLKFSVTASKQVIFAHGNLVVAYRDSGDHEWAFEDHQWDYSFGDGGRDASVGYQVDGTRISYFGWGTSGIGTARPPYEISVTNSLYTWSDWGLHFDDAGNGSNAKTDGTCWYTLAQSEWDHLIIGRDNHAGLVGQGRIYIDGEDRYVNGLIILPDNWALPSGCQFTSGTNLNFTANSYTTGNTTTGYNGKWSDMEAAGAVFLPAAGNRYSLGSVPAWTFGDEGYNCYYWSSSAYYSSEAYSLYFVNSMSVDSDNTHYRYQGHCVRLVHNLASGLKPVIQPIGDERDF